MIVKFCGIRREEDVEYCNILRPTMIGLIFANSPRKVEKDVAKRLLAMKNPSIKSVGVFKNQNYSEVLSISKDLQLDFIQLHSSESIEFITYLKSQGFKIIKAVEVENMDDIERSKIYKDIADFILLDRPKGKDVDIIKLAKNADFDFIIAGGITPENIEKYLALNPLGVDVSSGIETNGFKDFNKMKTIMEKLTKCKVGEVKNG
ncbi:Phosphoribosylanthranilate isomerase [Caldicellulosiruptor saccharolyticus DSM 8903]|uniref:N-(5'-phosphoribosyl)anthranilate isomerase n=1 Tax=Caldicellulosiruptor saccharolyticus (strain ATCC 43494 / DSM 8903 / Tp8T 6331) TaxID=351627 RepID=A4XLM5_CALS8|nr:phosphoribosylanthranilate isomerase [Caldicellulosiruptor saccharolyticus]ABP67810.1 Phosphoribosylanthranilate isomerase [Caldicellulosiruptor saccharolyticus DSM 8903]